MEGRNLDMDDGSMGLRKKLARRRSIQNTTGKELEASTHKRVVNHVPNPQSSRTFLEHPSSRLAYSQENTT